MVLESQTVGLHDALGEHVLSWHGPCFTGVGGTVFTRRHHELIQTIGALEPAGSTLSIHEVLGVDGTPLLGRRWCRERIHTRNVGMPLASALDHPDENVVAAFSEFVPSGAQDDWYTFLEANGTVRAIAQCRGETGLSSATLRTLRRRLLLGVSPVLAALSPVARPFFAILDVHGAPRSSSAEAPEDWQTADRMQALRRGCLELGESNTRSLVIPGYLVQLRRLTSEQTTDVLASFAPVTTASPPRLALLSPTQARIVRFAAAGATAPEIARALGRSPGTVRTHLREAYRRLDVASRVELTESADELTLWGAR